MNPEISHYLAVDLLKFTLKLPGGKWAIQQYFNIPSKPLKTSVFGLEFPNPVGLAAGFDKNATFFDEFGLLGFGFVEIGTVTPKPQPGNDKPRLFRLPKEKALINRMGFNNDGVDVVSARLKNRRTNIIIGGNIGKNKTTPNENAVDDYVICFEKLFDVVDYFVVNVSSPNTPGLRSLQEKGPLTEILRALQDRNLQKTKAKPILLKIAPDLTHSQLDDIIEIVQETKIAGVIATNTTIDRNLSHYSKEEVEKIGMGGLSGLPVTLKSLEVIHYLYTKANGAFPIIGVGGIDSAQTAREKLAAGASLVQVYTGLIYEGPSLVKNILRGL